MSGQSLQINSKEFPSFSISSDDILKQIKYLETQALDFPEHSLMYSTQLDGIIYLLTSVGQCEALSYALAVSSNIAKARGGK